MLRPIFGRLPHREGWGVRGLLASLVLIGGGITALAQVNGQVKVVSRVYNGYTRAVSADGSRVPESYIFIEGGMIDQEPVANDSINRIGFDEVARQLAAPLRSQGYVPSRETESAQLLIMVWYGNTRNTVHKPANYQAMEDESARILGYEKVLSQRNALSFTSVSRDFYDEFRGGRYFVVLKAYDLQLARKEKKLKPLWETRFSLLRQASDFAADLPAMAQFAAITFGKDTGGIFNPDLIKGEVRIDELKILGEAPANPTRAK
jgi:hypothetical protein